jgi:hypothetical protein
VPCFPLARGPGGRGGVFWTRQRGERALPPPRPSPSLVPRAGRSALTWGGGGGGGTTITTGAGAGAACCFSFLNRSYPHSSRLRAVGRGASVRVPAPRRRGRARAIRLPADQDGGDDAWHRFGTHFLVRAPLSVRRRVRNRPTCRARREPSRRPGQKASPRAQGAPARGPGLLRRRRAPCLQIDRRRGQWGPGMEWLPAPLKMN